MLEGLDIAPLIGNGFTPDTIAAPEAEAPTLDAALREAARVERAEATMLDLWLHRPGGSNLSALERPALGAQTSWHALAALSGDGGGVLDLGGGKDVPLFAALNDDEEIVVVGPRPNEVDEDDEGGSWGYGGGAYPGGPTGPDVGEGGGTLDEPEQNDCSDRNALAAEGKIEDMPDNGSKEYGSVIYRDASGAVRHSDPIPGPGPRVELAAILHWLNINGVPSAK